MDQNAVKHYTLVPEAKIEGCNVDLEFVKSLLKVYIDLTNVLDAAKKAFAYGKSEVLDMMDMVAIADRMEDFILEIHRTANSDSTLSLVKDHDTANGVNLRILHGILGILTESGEMAEILVNHIESPETPIDTINLSEEIFDDLWYQEVLLDEIGVDRETSTLRGIRKLQKRYPDGFNSVDATHRDLDAERRILEGAV